MTLERYLQDVTAPFPPDTARRIHRDLEEHALAQAEALREAGHPDPEAAALAALGPVCEVRQALEASHYTQVEEEELLAIRAYRQSKVPSLFQFLLELPLVLAMPVVLPMLFGREKGFGWEGYAVYAVGVLLFQVAAWLFPRRLSARSGRVVLMLLRASGSVFTLLSVQILWFWGTSDFWVVLGGGLLGAALAHFFVLRRLWHYWPKALRNAR